MLIIKLGKAETSSKAQSVYLLNLVEAVINEALLIKVETQDISRSLTRNLFQKSLVQNMAK